MASSLIGTLRVALSLGTAEFEKGANKAAAIARSKAKSIETSFASAKTAVNGLFAAFTVGFLAEQIKKSLDYAGSLAEVSRTLGVTTKDLQTFRFAATQSGVAQDELEIGLRRLTISMGKAELGSKAQVAAFNAIGISVAQLKGKTTGDVFRLIADGLGKVTNRAQRAAVEVALFGKTGSTLDNLLAPGSKRLNELAEAAQKLGIVLSDSQIQGAEETAHKLEAVKAVLSAQIAGVVADNANAILSLSSALATLTGQIVRFLGSNPQLALGIVGALLGGRVGGLPGAALGGAVGAILGQNVAESSADSNTNLNFRVQQMRAAQKEFLTRQAAQADTGSLFSVRHGNARSGATLETARKEWIRQIGLLQQATAQAKAREFTPAPGVNIKPFLAGKERTPRPKRAPRDRTEQDEFAFEQESRRADMDILSAKLQLSHDVAEQAAIQLAMLDLERASREAEIAHRVVQAERDLNEGKITRSTFDEIVQQAAILKAKGEEADALKRKAILEQKAEELARQQSEIAQHGFQIEQELLQKQADLATTASERRKIELELLEIAYQAKRQALQDIVDHSKDKVAITNARSDLAALDANHALDRQSVLQQTRGPLDQWAASVPQTAAQINEALQSIEAQGLDGLSGAITDVITGTRSLKQAFGELAKSVISEIIQMTVKMLIFRALSAAFGGGFGGLGGAEPTSLGSLPTSLSTGDVISGLPGFAAGGSMKILGNFGTDRNSLALNGVPIARVSRGEHLNVSNDNGGGSVAAPVTFNFHNYARMSDGEARRTGTQAAAGFSSEMAAVRRKGIA